MIYKLFFSFSTITNIYRVICFTLGGNFLLQIFQNNKNKTHNWMLSHLQDNGVKRGVSLKCNLVCNEIWAIQILSLNFFNKPCIKFFFWNSFCSLTFPSKSFQWNLILNGRCCYCVFMTWCWEQSPFESKHIAHNYFIVW